MARPRQFEEGAALNAAMLCFWRHGYDATSIKDLSGATGLTTASLYNAFGDKRALYQRAFDHYVEGTIAERIRRLETHPGRDAIAMFFREILDRSLGDPEHKGCLLVNAAPRRIRTPVPDEPNPACGRASDERNTGCV